ncbi:uncharacterized protein LOC130737570 [Lotus japonicus]|uniref:uncharacterized protein LOC130737570 n=1 Tax=Lotus japonicus TaxID=34305 RepID=UPI002585E5C9|nr:uncharacterized protein LOC130737570 [Lotus japonicus]XP_057445363.1 uncharacterized protein LOC130737570 [Lotus japonicus]
MDLTLSFPISACLNQGASAMRAECENALETDPVTSRPASSLTAIPMEHTGEEDFQLASVFNLSIPGVVLQVLDGRTWSVSFNLGKFNAGWKKFTSVNNLKVGDVCLFELNKRVPLSLKVLIFPLAEELHSPP